jgi:hypothetical protein
MAKDKSSRQSSDATQRKLDQAGDSVADAAIAAQIKAKILEIRAESGADQRRHP